MGETILITAGEAISGVSRLGIDTAPIIYFIESHSDYDTRVTPFFQMIEDGKLSGFVSTISLTEVLTVPVRLGQTQLYLQYRDLLVHSEHLHIVPVDVAIAERASVLRAQYALRTPDALQIASAMVSGCDAFLTNDAGLKKITDVRVILLDDLTP